MGAHGGRGAREEVLEELMREIADFEREGTSTAWDGGKGELVAALEEHGELGGGGADEEGGLEIRLDGVSRALLVGLEEAVAREDAEFCVQGAHEGGPDGNAGADGGGATGGQPLEQPRLDGHVWVLVRRHVDGEAELVAHGERGECRRGHLVDLGVDGGDEARHWVVVSGASGDKFRVLELRG